MTRKKTWCSSIAKAREGAPFVDVMAVSHHDGRFYLHVNVDFFVDKHPHYSFDGAPSFSAAYGFISCVLLVLVAKVLRMLLMKDEDYYDD